MDREHVWEVTTAHGTRIILDPGEESRWMRIPTIAEDGRLNQPAPTGRTLAAAVDGLSARCWGRRGGVDIEVGKPLHVHTGIHERWDITTVVALRSLSAEEIPLPLPSTLDDAP